MDIEIAKKEFLEKDYSIVAVKNGKIIYKSKDRGILPIYNLIIGNKEKEMVIADKIIGAGAAKISILGNVKYIYTELISESAKKILDENNIKYDYKNSCKNILNFNKTDLCPIEKIAVKNVNNNEFIDKVEKFLNK